MSGEERRVFKLDAVLALLCGVGGAEANDLVCYLVGRDCSAQEVTVAATLAKAWLFKVNPAFMDSKYDETGIYEDWIKAEKKRIGADNVSITAIPCAEVAPITAVLDTLAHNKETIIAKDAEIEELNGTIDGLKPFEGKTASLEKQVADLTAKIAKLEEEKSALQAETAEFKGKLPVAEGELNDTIKEIVTKALKDAVASVPMGAAAGAAVAAGGEAVAEAPAEEEGSSVPDDFGFGTSGSDGDGFGF